MNATQVANPKRRTKHQTRTRARRSHCDRRPGRTANHAEPPARRPGARRPGARRPGARRPGARRPGARRPGARRPVFQPAPEPRRRDPQDVVCCPWEGPQPSPCHGSTVAAGLPRGTRQIGPLTAAIRRASGWPTWPAKPTDRRPASAGHRLRSRPGKWPLRGRVADARNP
jgi:hypothetical protein